MLTIIWKELRENSKWALLALLALTVAEFYALSLGRKGYNNAYNELTLCSSSFFMVTSFGCSAVAAALGAVQILPELNRDRWASLLHRPVSRRAIFFGKVLAGMLLYLAAALISFFVSVIYVALPGQFPAPFVPGMMIPALDDILFGLVVYFAALLICLHRGRWFGSRGLVGLAVLPLVVLNSFSEWPLLLTAIESLIFMLGAWQAIESNGGTQRAARGFTRIPFVLVVLLGAETALVCLFIGLQFLPLKKTAPASSYSQFAITPDDKIFISTQRGDGSASVVTDTDGHVVTDERYVGNNAIQAGIQLYPLATIGTTALQDEYLQDHPQNLRNYVQPLEQATEGENWYLLIGARYFVGYDKLSRRLVGTIGLDGFKAAGTPARPFPERLQSYDFWSPSPFYYWVGSQLYAIDFSNRSLKPFFNAGSDTIYGAMGLAGSLTQDKALVVALALRDGVRIFDPQGRTLFTTPYRHDPAVSAELSIAANARSSKIYLQYSPTEYLSPNGPRHPLPPVFLDQVDWQGRLLHTYSYPSQEITPTPPGVIDHLFNYAAPLLPTTLDILWNHLFHANRDIGDDDASSVSFLNPNGGISDIVVTSIIALILAVVTWLGAARAGLSRKRSAWWSFFVFCFGLPGLLTFRLASNWPARVPCPSCGRKRPVIVEECPHCHQKWPLAPATGVEIFDFSLSEKPG